MNQPNYDRDLALAHFQARVDYTTGTHELQVLSTSDADPASYQIVDVRFADDYAASRIPGAVNLPMAKWGQPRYLERVLNKDATLYVYCYNATCHLAAQAAVKLVQAGYRVVEVEGGYEDWVNKGLEVDSTPPLAESA